jgi:hypothetical protein
VLLAGIAVAFVLWRRSSQRDPMRLALLVFLVYVVLSAAVAAAARAGLESSDPFSSRYFTTSLLGWSALALVLAPHVRDTPELRGAALAAACLALTVLLPGQLAAFGDDGPFHARLRMVAALALDLPVRDLEATNALSPDAGLQKISAEARRRNLSVFALPDLVRARESIGRTAESLDLVRCRGSVDVRQVVATDAGAVKVYGWALHPERERTPPILFLADAGGTVIGAAVPAPSSAVAGEDPRRFEGYVRGENPAEIQILCAR